VSRNYNKYLLEYAQFAFSDLNEPPEFVTALNIVVNSHRHQKVSEDVMMSSESSFSFMSSDSKEFSIVRDVMCKYSKNS